MAAEAEAKKGSVLAMMAASITDRKTVASRGLTPIAGESGSGPRIPEVASVFLTNEAVADIAKDLRRQAAVLIEVAEGLDGHTAVSSVPTIVADERDIKRQAEKEADERAKVTTPETEAIKARIAVVTADAKAAVHEVPGTALPNQVEDTPFAEVMHETSVLAADGWTCPEHGTAIDKTSPKGRAYRGCGHDGCRNFELPS